MIALASRWTSSFPEPGPQDDHAPGLDAHAPKGIAYRCTECVWTGRGGVKAFDHHREDHHAIALITGQVISFSCCEDVNGRRVDAEPCLRCGAVLGQSCVPWCDEV